MAGYGRHRSQWVKAGLSVGQSVKKRTAKRKILTKKCRYEGYFGFAKHINLGNLVTLLLENIGWHSGDGE